MPAARQIDQPCEESPEAPVSAADLDACLDTLARLIEMGEEQYMVLYERLEGELMALGETETVEDRIARRLTSRRDRPVVRDRMEARSAAGA